MALIKKPPKTAPPMAFYRPKKPKKSGNQQLVSEAKSLTPKGIRRVAPPAKSMAPYVPPVVTTKRGGTTTTPSGPKTGQGAVVDPNDPNSFIAGLLTNATPESARALIDQVYGPQRDLIQQMIAEEAGRAQARADQMKQVYAAFAQFVGGMAGQVQNIYSTAQNQIDSRSKGFQDGLALAENQSGAGLNATMASIGSPQQAAGYDAAGHLAVQSAADSNALAQAGAGWASYAAAMPGIYSLAATQNIKQMLGVSAENEHELRLKLLELSSKEASDILDYLQSAQDKDNQLKMWAYEQTSSQQSAAATLAEKTREFNAGQAIITAKQKSADLKLLSDIKYKQARLTQYDNQLREKIAHDKAIEGNSKNTLAERKRARQDRNALEQQRIDVSQQQADLRGQAVAISAGRAAETARHNRVIEAKKPAAGRGPKNTRAQDARKGIGTAQASAGAYATSLRQATKGSTSVSKGGVRVSEPVPRYNRREIWGLVYKKYARQLFAYYQTLFPKRGKYQDLVEKVITSAVGYGPYG